MTSLSLKALARYLGFEEGYEPSGEEIWQRTGEALGRTPEMAAEALRRMTGKELHELDNDRHPDDCGPRALP